MTYWQKLAEGDVKGIVMPFDDTIRNLRLEGLSLSMAQRQDRLEEDQTMTQGKDQTTALCEDCPPVGYPTDKTRCTPCPRRSVPSIVSEQGFAQAAQLILLTIVLTRMPL